MSAEIRCFVIGPIGDKDAEVGTDDRQRYEDALQVYERVIKPACTQLGLNPSRADLISRPGEITEQVFVRLRDYEVVVADLTDANPNVMYELGLRHSRDRLTVQIGEKARLPFDVSVIRTIPFVRDDYGLIEARDSLKAMLETGLSSGYDRVTATRLWMDNETAATNAAALIGDEADEPGYLEKMATAEEAFPRMTDSLVALNEVIGQIGALAEESTPEMSRAGSSGSKLMIANRYADRLEPLAEMLEGRAGSYADSIMDADPGIKYLLERIRAGELTDKERQSSVAFLDSIIQLGDTAAGSIESTKSFASSVVENAKASRKMRQPSDRVDRSLRRTIEATNIVAGWAGEAREIAAEPPSPGP